MDRVVVEGVDIEVGELVERRLECVEQSPSQVGILSNICFCRNAWRGTIRA
jgi:hypothetical protein